MTSFVYDFKDINSRMKGDLLERKEPSKLCPRCNGTKRIEVSRWSGVPMYEDCPDCVKSYVFLDSPVPQAPAKRGLVPKANLKPILCMKCGGTGMVGPDCCTRCNGSGVEP